MFPLGNLRESPKSALFRADFSILIGSDDAIRASKENILQQCKSKIIEGKFEADIVAKLRGRKIVAFCGIGRPQKFFSMLRDLNFRIMRQFPFPDHYFYSELELVNILETANKYNAIVVTTEKDFVKLPTAYQKIIYPIKIGLRLSNNENLLLELEKLVI